MSRLEVRVLDEPCRVEQNDEEGVSQDGVDKGDERSTGRDGHARDGVTGGAVDPFTGDSIGIVEMEIGGVKVEQRSNAMVRRRVNELMGQ